MRPVKVLKPHAPRINRPRLTRPLNELPNLFPVLVVLLLALLGAGAAIFSVLYFVWSLL